MQSGIEDQPSRQKNHAPEKNGAQDESADPLPGIGARGNPSLTREEVVARGRLLVRDSRYPDDRILKSVARVIAERLYPGI